MRNERKGVGLRTEISERQRRVGAELRRLRENAGLSAPEAGARIGIRGPAVSHIEAGRLGINLERLTAWLDLYGCSDSLFREALTTMSRRTGKGWWTAYHGVVTPSALDLAESEDNTRSLASYETLLIPGLLQIADYARVILANSSSREHSLRFRIDRQRILEAHDPTPLHAVIHESALHQHYGGKQVMREQLLHLLEVSDLPQVTLQILPFTCQEYASTDTPFMVMTAEHSALDTVLMEHPVGSVYLADPAAVSVYRSRFNRLTELALPPVNSSPSSRVHAERDSWGLIQHILYTL